MATKGASTKGIMLPDELWAEIERTADLADKSRSAMVHRLVLRGLRHDLEVGNSDKNVDDADVEFE